jgi:hypothetical protein
MPKREEAFSNCLVDRFGCGYFSKPSIKDFLDSNIHQEIERVYRLLNGQQAIYPAGFNGYDIMLKNFIVELDEEQYFNRYRLLTLDSFIYNNNISFSSNYYKSICKKHESDCFIKDHYRKYWKTDSSDKQFGKSAPEGILAGDGSSRWRQRAFYDFLRDAGQFMGNYKLIRISVHQVIDSNSVGVILGKELTQYYPVLFDQIEKSI